MRREDIKIGSVVIVRPGFGGDSPVQVTVTEDPSPHKHSVAFSYDLAPGDSRWAYLDQIDRVVSL